MSTADPSTDPDFENHFRRAAGFIATGVAVISTPEVSMTVSSLHTVSLEPPWVCVCIDGASRKGRAIIETKAFRARVLRSDEESVARFGEAPESGGLVHLDCEISWTRAVGDHELVLAKVRSVEISGGEPLIYWRRGLHGFRPLYPFIETPESFARLVATWEAGRLPKNEWTHAAHVAVGAASHVRHGARAMDHLRAGIKRHNASVGTIDSVSSGYHETLTRFWLGVVSRATTGVSDPWLAASHAVRAFGEERDLHRLYYSFDVVRSAEARAAWVPPDLTGPY